MQQKAAKQFGGNISLLLLRRRMKDNQLRRKKVEEK